MSDNPYETALNAAYEELQKLKEQELEIAIRKAKLRETMNALFPLVFPDKVEINSLSLPNAMRLIFQSAGRPLNAADFLTKLQDIGFDVGKFDNPLANIHTAMARMVESDEMVWVEVEGKKKGIPGPELKPVPQELPQGAVLKALLEAYQKKDAEEKK
jgi:hypothetical protein